MKKIIHNLCFCQLIGRFYHHFVIIFDHFCLFIDHFLSLFLTTAGANKVGKTLVGYVEQVHRVQVVNKNCPFCQKQFWFANATHLASFLQFEDQFQAIKREIFPMLLKEEAEEREMGVKYREERR